MKNRLSSFINQYEYEVIVSLSKAWKRIFDTAQA